MYHPSSLALTARQISTVRPWPKASKRTLLWQTWIWQVTASALKGQRLGVWLRIVWRRGKRAGGFHRKDQDIATWKWSQWNAQRTWKQCTVCFIFADLKWEAGSLEYIVLQCFPGWGTPKSRYIMIWYIGPQMCYMRTSVHLLTLGHTLNQSCLSNVESRSFTIEHNSFRDRRCVLLLLVAEHFLKGQMHGDSDSSLVVLW